MRLLFDGAVVVPKFACFGYAYDIGNSWGMSNSLILGPTCEIKSLIKSHDREKIVLLGNVNPR